MNAVQMTHDEIFDAPLEHDAVRGILAEQLPELLPAFDAGDVGALLRGTLDASPAGRAATVIVMRYFCATDRVRELLNHPDFRTWAEAYSDLVIRPHP